MIESLCSQMGHCSAHGAQSMCKTIPSRRASRDTSERNLDGLLSARPHKPHNYGAPLPYTTISMIHPHMLPPCISPAPRGADRAVESSPRQRRNFLLRSCVPSQHIFSMLFSSLHRSWVRPIRKNQVLRRYPDFSLVASFVREFFTSPLRQRSEAVGSLETRFRYVSA